MDYHDLIYEKTNGVAKITLNRPDAGNAITLELAKEMRYAALDCGQDSTIRAVLIEGSGNNFCYGGDLNLFSQDFDKFPVVIKDTAGHLHDAISFLQNMDAPVITVVQGTAAGAGMSLACAGDIVLAAESARFSMAYTRVGLSPDGGATYSIPRLVGLRRALELSLTNRLLSAREALDWGLITRVVPDADLFQEAEKLASQLASGATRAIGAVKRLMYRGWAENLETQLADECERMADMATSYDAREGVTAFLKKRPPLFRGE